MDFSEINGPKPEFAIKIYFALEQNNSFNCKWNCTEKCHDIVLNCGIFFSLSSSSTSCHKRIPNEASSHFITLTTNIFFTKNFPFTFYSCGAAVAWLPCFLFSLFRLHFESICNINWCNNQIGTDTKQKPYPNYVHKLIPFCIFFVRFIYLFSQFVCGEGKENPTHLLLISICYMGGWTISIQNFSAIWKIVGI